MKSLTLLLPLLFSLGAAAQEVCPCIPRPPLWIVKTCADFDCAMTALTAANGDPLTFVMPVGVNDRRWVVMQRVVAGAYTDDGSDPYVIETFDGAPTATARFSAIDGDHRPMMFTAPDGMFLVVSLRHAPIPRQRSADH